MHDLRPICQCNVAYKILSKTLANGLAKVIGKCVSEEQPAFVSGRSIVDNALIANEVIHHMKCRRRGLKGEIALKLDISKAYDRISRSILKAVLIKMGFDTKRVN